jgi:hypothetical protein
MLPSELSCEMWQRGEDAEHLGRPSYCPVMVYMPVYILCHSPRGEVSMTDDMLWCGRPGSLTGRTFHGETRPCWVSPGVRMILMIMRVHVVMSCQMVMERAPVLKCLVLDARGACGYVL